MSGLITSRPASLDRKIALRCLFAIAWVLIAVSLIHCTSGVTNGVWRETFDAPGDWQLSADAAADVTVLDGHLRIHVFEPGQVAWSSIERVYDDFVLHVQASQVSGPADNEYGVLVRMDGDASFYAFSVSGDGYVRAAHYHDGVWEVLGSDWIESEAVNQGVATNALTVEAQGAHYVFRVNEQEVLYAEHIERLKGTVGLYAGAFTEGDVVVTFDDFEVQPLP